MHFLPVAAQGLVVDHNVFDNFLVRDLVASLGETVDELVSEQCRIQEAPGLSDRTCVSDF
jgi:hypothetical protein